MKIHADYPKIEAEAKTISEDLGIKCLWNDHTFREASKEDEERIQAALDSEEAIPKNGDWAVKLGINLFYSANLSRSPLYSKQMPYNSVIYDAFGRSSPAVLSTRSDGYGRRPGKQKKVVAGKWCGKVWMSSQVHPFLAKRDPEEDEDYDERSFNPWAIPDEKLERKPDSSRKNDNTMVAKKYVRKRKMPVESGSTKKAKCIEKEEAVSDNSVDDKSHQQHRRFLRSKPAICIKRGSTKKVKCIDTEDAISDDSIDDNSDEQHKRILKSKQAKSNERDDIVSDDSLGDDSHQQSKQITRSRRTKLTGREDVVSDDSLDSNSEQLHRRIRRSKQAKYIGREDSVSDDFSGDNSYKQQRRSHKRKQAKSMEREEESLDEPLEDNSCQQHKRILRSKRTKSAIQQKMKRESSRHVKQATSKPLKQVTRKQEKMKQQTPRIRNNQSELNTFDSCAEEEQDGGPSTRLRKRTPKPQKVPVAKLKEQQQMSKNKAKKPSSVGKARASHNESKSRDEDAEFLCDIEGCTMSFGSKQELVLHKRNICPVKGCGKKFFSHKYLVQHRRVHMDERPLRCPWKGCKMTFKWAWARTEHIRVHTGARPYVCAESGCGQTFRFVSDFSRHKRKTGHSTKKGR